MTSLWDVQDALVAALRAQEALAAVEVGLGFPKQVQPKHVWVAGRAGGEQSAELSGVRGRADETLRLTVIVYSQSPDYVEARDALAAMADGVVGALGSDEFAEIVPAWGLAQFNVDEGTDGTHKQLALEVTVECRCW